mgnify:FL=1
MLRIGMLTSGGDCQALNAAMRGVVKGICSKRDDVEIYGFKDGYKGLIYADFSMLTPKDFFRHSYKRRNDSRNIETAV